MILRMKPAFGFASCLVLLGCTYCGKECVPMFRHDLTKEFCSSNVERFLPPPSSLCKIVFCNTGNTTAKTLREKVEAYKSMGYFLFSLENMNRTIPVEFGLVEDSLIHDVLIDDVISVIILGEDQSLCFAWRYPYLSESDLLEDALQDMIVSEAKTDDIACFSSDIQQKIPASAKIVEILCEPDVRNETIFNIVKELYIHGFRDIHIYIHLSHFHFSSELAVDVVHPTNRAPRVVEYAYDHRGRMVWKTIGGTNGPLDTALAYVWDDYNIVRESRNGEYTYNVWGLDLNGTLQGCGGVGGLLAVAKSGEVYTPTYDANGNISEYVDSSGTIIAHQEYDPFGNAVVSSGNVDSFTHWFSTKPWCGVTGMVEYQLRKLNTEIGSFLSRDHIDNNQVYGFSRNVGFNGFDFFGTFWGK